MTFFLLFSYQKSITALCDAVDKDQLSSRAVARSMLTSLGQLKCRHERVLNGIAEWMVANLSELQERDLVTFAITAASLNYVPTVSEPLFKVGVLSLPILSIFVASIAAYSYIIVVIIIVIVFCAWNVGHR